jgi:hypothetical protein
MDEPRAASAASSPTSPADALRGSRERALKNGVLTDKFMTKLVIPKLHDKVKRLFEVDEGLKQVRTAPQADKPQLFVKLGESCFAQLVVGLPRVAGPLLAATGTRQPRCRRSRS